MFDEAYEVNVPNWRVSKSKLLTQNFLSLKEVATLRSLFCWKTMFETKFETKFDFC